MPGRRKRDESDDALRPSAPGWYPDPFSADGSGERYFDGSGWSATGPAYSAVDDDADARSPARNRYRLIAIVVLVAFFGGIVIGVIRALAA